MNTNVSTQLVITEKALKRHTKRLQQEMLQFKKDFKLSEAQNMLAKIFGTKDFNELNTIIKQKSNNHEYILNTEKDNNVIFKINTLPEYSQKSIDYLANLKPTWEKQFTNNLDAINKKYLDMLSEIYYHFSYLYSSEDTKIQHIKNKQKIWELLQYAILNQNIINFDLFNKEGYNLLELVLTVDINSPFILILINKTCVDKHLYLNKNVLYIALFKRKANKRNINAILKKIKRETLLKNNYKLPKNISSCLLTNAKYHEKDIARCLLHCENQSKIKQNNLKKSLIDYDQKIKTVIKDVSSIHSFEVSEDLLKYINKYN